MQTVTVTRVGVTLDLLLWRAHGRPGQTSAMLRAGLDLNPGLADAGAVIALGTVVTLPDLPPVRRPARRAVVDLFGGAA
jgi:phage tail protein X